MIPKLGQLVVVVVVVMAAAVMPLNTTLGYAYAHPSPGWLIRRAQEREEVARQAGRQAGLVSCLN